MSCITLSHWSNPRHNAYGTTLLDIRNHIWNAKAGRRNSRKRYSIPRSRQQLMITVQKLSSTAGEGNKATSKAEKK